MVSVPAQPPGVSVKSISALGANSTLTPMMISTSATISLDSNLNSSEVFHNLVDSIKAHNQMVRKLNVSKRYRQADHNYIEVVSDDEVEVDMPDINEYMNITDNPSELHPTVYGTREHVDPSIPTTGANAVTPTDLLLEHVQGTDTIWQ